MGAARFREAKASRFLFPFLPEVFLWVGCFPGALQGLSESLSVKEEQIDKHKNSGTSLFSLGLVPGKPA